MTVNTPENKLEQTLPPEKVEAKIETIVSKEAKVDEKQQQSQVATEDKEDPNWKAFREARKKDRSEREAAERRAAEKDAEVTALKAAMEAAFSRGNSMQSTNVNGYPEEETEDQRIEKKVNELISRRDAENERIRLEREAQEYPMRLMKDLPDFNHVISQENRDYLDYHFPEISRPLGRLPDGYDKWFDIYHAIKKLVPNHHAAKKDLARADANAMKPKSISSTGITQAQAVPGSHILSEERKAANWSRMQQHLKGVG